MPQEHIGWMLKNADWSSKITRGKFYEYFIKCLNVCEGTDQTGIIKKDISEKYGFNLQAVRFMVALEIMQPLQSV